MAKNHSEKLEWIEAIKNLQVKYFINFLLIFLIEKKTIEKKEIKKEFLISFQFNIFFQLLEDILYFY